MASWWREHLLRCAPARTPTAQARGALALPARAEIYSTGKANLPGSTRQRDLLESFARMVPELLRHSDRPEVGEKLPEHLRLAHRPRDVTRDDARVVALSKAVVPVRDLFVADECDWDLAPLGPVNAADLEQVEADDLLNLAGF